MMFKKSIDGMICWGESKTFAIILFVFCVGRERPS